MKIRILILTLLLFSLAKPKIYSQCGDELISRGMEELVGTTFIKDYKVILNKSKKKFPASASYSLKLEKGK